jgi:hypothetical protein
MEALIIAAITAALLIVYILFNPLNLKLAHDIESHKTTGRIKFFPFEHQFLLKRKKKKAPELEPKKEVEAVSKKKKTGKLRFATIWRLLIDEYETLKKTLISCLYFISGILKSPDRYFLKINLAGGVGPPDLTGELFGVIQSIRPMLGNSISIDYHPDFTVEEIKGDLTAGIRVRIISVLKEILIFGWKLPKLKLIKIYRTNKKGERDDK